MINNPIVKRLNKILLELRKKSINNKNEADSLKIETLRSFLGEVDRHVFGEQRPDLSDQRIKGLMKNFHDKIAVCHETAPSDFEKKLYSLELEFVKSWSEDKLELNDQEIDLNIQKIYKTLAQSNDFLKSINKKHIISIEFYRQFIPTIVKPEQFNARLENFFKDEIHN